MKMFSYLFALLLITASCGDDDDATVDIATPPDVLGMNFVASERSFEETYTTLRDALEANPNITIIAEVDHRANAASVGLELNQTRVIFFGNPRLGTPLMNRNPTTGIDLPQKMLVYEDDKGDVYIGYNNTVYLDARYALNSEVETLTQISNALSMFAGDAGDSNVQNPSSSVIPIAEGFVQDVSNDLFFETYDRLKTAIMDNPNLTIMAEVDHKANAESVDLNLPPTRVIIFGNPNLGTPLMQNSQTTALDLPQKILVWQNDIGTVQVAYNDPGYIRQRHSISDNDDTLATIASALQNLSNVATGN